MGSLKHRSWRRAGTGQRGLHLRPVVQQAPRKSPWPPSSINMFGSCGPPSRLTLASTPVTRLWGSNGCTSPLGGTCHPALGAAGSFSVPWQDPTQRGWYAGARSQKDRLVSVCSGHSAAERGRPGKSNRVQAYVLTPGSLCSSPEVGTPLPGFCSQGGGRALAMGQNHREGELRPSQC